MSFLIAKEKIMATNPNNDRLMKILSASPEIQADIDLLLEGKKPLETVRSPILVGMKKAAEILGVSRATLWRMMNAETFEKVEILPGSYRLRYADILAFVNGKKEAL